jgi:uncharacterized protein (DUF1919 family)
MTYEGLRLKVQKYWRKGLSGFRKKKLHNTDFTIISNNCWGGMIYESYNLPKESPTVGLFFMAEDYIKFLQNLKEYISTELIFIKPEQSRWKEQFCGDKRFGHYPVGLLKDIEIFFLHYHSEQEAKEKWKRRCQRINWDRLLIKFNDQNCCTMKEVEEFMSLPYKNKVFFTCKDWKGISSEQYVLIHQKPKYDFIMASFEPFGKNKYSNITDLINNL